MEIVDIRTIPLSYRCEPPYGSAGGMQARRGGLLVEIETDERVIGIGEAGVGGGATAGVIEKLLAPMLIGEDPLLIEGLWQKMFARTRQFGRRGIIFCHSPSISSGSSPISIGAVAEDVRANI